MDEIKCPKCMSQNIHAGKKGFSTGKAIAGTIIANPVVGAIAGTHRSNKIVLTCLNCGHQFKPGEQLKTKPVAKKLPDGVNVNKTELDESYSITCSYCGKMSSTSFRACPKCGRHFLPEEKAAAKQTALEGGNKPTKVGCLGIVLLFIATGGLLIFI
jgi:ssDNA-binding Zn-finger/Zn-ribbon topoisomerase 1